MDDETYAFSGGHQNDVHLEGLHERIAELEAQLAEMTRLHTLAMTLSYDLSARVNRIKGLGIALIETLNMERIDDRLTMSDEQVELMEQAVISFEREGE